MLEMFEILDNVACGGYSFDEIIPNTVHTVITIFKIAIPVLLIIFGILDLGKAVISNDEKEIKGAQGKFIKRCIYAVAVFFVVALVQFVFANLDSGEEDNISSCINCFANGDCD